MTSKETPTPPPSNHDVEHSIGALLKLAGERTSPSTTATMRARVAAHTSWRQAVNRKQLAARKRRFMSLFAGGALAASVAAFMLMHTTSLAIVEVAQIVKTEGDVQRLDQRSVIRTAQSVTSGETIQTLQGRVALNINGLSLRLDRNTRLVATSAQDMRLEYGRVYVDSEGINNHAVLKIHTPQGLVQHEGTQYQVAADDHETRVQVREGRVNMLLDKTQQHVQLGAGQTVTMNANQMGDVQSQPGYGDEWSWAADIAPEFNIEGRPLSELLVWLAREHGWHVRYESIEVERTALDTRLHGALLARNTKQQLENIGLITGMNLRLDQGVLLVASQTEEK
ncbi:MAG TPA: FecR family protein [Steroidobacteraceae bacterium]|nr:FecR family protein [Steroidobacteraceae bacterium]